tara:strand:- start:368 stop:523 length:156 start_codon:yes stop_codon:yes gene_type:complete
MKVLGDINHNPEIVIVTSKKVPVDATKMAPEVGIDPRVFGQLQINVYTAGV